MEARKLKEGEAAMAAGAKCKKTSLLGRWKPDWEAAAADRETLTYIDTFQRDDRTVAAVCTGGMIVGAAGLLDGRTATTKREVFAGETSPLEIMAQRFDVASAVAARVVDEGVVVTGGGVSLGIDMTLHLLQQRQHRHWSRRSASSPRGRRRSPGCARPRSS